MARSTVPKFGNWEHEDSVPYTVYFDKARKKKGEKMINPNDPQQNPVRPTTPDHTEARTYNNNNNNNNNNYSNESSYGGRRSPLHPQYQGNLGNQVRSRLRPVSGDEIVDKSHILAVPKFGAWNDSDSQSGENFTHIFDQVRDQRNTGGTGNPSATPKHRSYTDRSQHSKDPKKCCFPWW